jgi:mannobiose 2-epimerase
MPPVKAPSCEAYRQLLVDHVIAPWFPRSIDREFGGFLSDFDRRWRAIGPNNKLLEFQARQTLTAAELMLAFPSEPQLAEAVAAGFAWLRDVMWDREYGGWYWLVDRAGEPIAQETKHLHGVAYAIQACVAVFAATGNPAALELAQRAFTWMDGHAHDSRNGGYFELLSRDGSVRTESIGTNLDHIGTPVGQKDMNVHSDLLETFTYFCAQAEDEVVRQRLDELMQIILTHYAAANGHPWFFFRADWSPASTYVRPSTAVQTASRIIEARPFTSDHKILEEAAWRLVDSAFEHGWNATRGALVFGRFIDREMTREELNDIHWWVQIEALKALEYCDVIAPRYIRNGRLKSDVWNTLVDHFIDPKYGGLYQRSRSELRLLDRILPTGRQNTTLQKGSVWKDASHEGRALLRLMHLSAENMKA